MINPKLNIDEIVHDLTNYAFENNRNQEEMLIVASMMMVTAKMIYLQTLGNNGNTVFENDKEIILWTSSGALKSQILGDNLVETEIGVPKTNWNEIPLNQNLDTKNLNIKIINKNNIEHLGGTSVNVGNPHVVFFVDNIEDYDLKKIGPEIENHKYFPEKCNVTLAKVINKKLIKVKVWERGAGLTKACGTAACATAVAANINELTDKTTDIEFALGRLSISIDENNSIHMKGPVSDIKNIEINI